MKIGLIVCHGCILAGSVNLFGAEGPPSDAELIRQLLERVQQLESRVKELEAAHPAAGQEPPAPAAPAPGHHMEMPAYSGDRSVSVRGYMDLGYRLRNSTAGTNSFELGQLDAFTTARLSPRLGVLVESVVEVDHDNRIGVDVERLLLQYRHSDFFNVDIGRYHTSIGYYNTAFHHGTWFQTAADRPFLFRFEDDGGILPIHNVGVSVSGRVPSGALGLSYVAELGNGRAYRSPDSEPVQGAIDENNGKALNLALRARPEMLPGLELGGSWYRDTLTPENAARIRQRIYAAHLVYARGRAEFLNEGVWMRHARGGGRTSVAGFYSQFGYRLGAAWRPYFRYEFMNPGASDPLALPLLGPGGWRRSFLGGVRYDVTEFAALKFQLERFRRRDSKPADEARINLAFTF